MYIKKISFALQLDSVSVASFSRVNIQFFWSYLQKSVIINPLSSDF